MRSLRRPAIVVPLVSILLCGGPAAERSLLAGGGAPLGQAARDEHPGPPDPCELALTPQGQANGLHRRCESAGSAGVARAGRARSKRRESLVTTDGTTMSVTRGALALLVLVVIWTPRRR